MKNQSKELCKIITNTAERRRKSIDQTFSQFVEMTYQYLVTGSYSISYQHLQDEHEEFSICLFNAMKENPYFDYFAEIMVELNRFDKKKLGQCMTPPSITNSVVRMLLGKKQIQGNTSDTTCGTGSFALAIIKDYVNAEKKTKPLFLLINDIDNRIAKIAVIQCLYNLFINNIDKSGSVAIRAFANDVIKEYSSNGHVIYDNDIDLINDEYVVSYNEYQKSQKFWKYAENLGSRVLNSMKKFEEPELA
jgi:type I restriction-modification system DNA methylase subunit